MAANKGFKLDATQFKRDLRTIERRLPGHGFKMIREETGYMGRDLAFYTPPFTSGGSAGKARGFGSPKDRKAGEAAVKADLDRAFTPWKSTGWKDEKIARLMRSQNFERIEATLKNFQGSPYKDYRFAPFSPALHTRARNRRGRVAKTQPVIAYPARAALAYRKKVIARVGRAKAAFARAAQRLGVKRSVPKWIARHFSAVTSTVTPRRGRNPSVTITAKEPGVSHAQRRLAFVLKIRQQSLAKRFRILHRALAKGTSLKPS